MKAALKRGLPVFGDTSPGWTLAYTVRASLGRLLLRLYRVNVIGAQNVPPSGGVILAGNHVSYLDPALLWCCSPRPTHFMAKTELWHSKPLGYLLDQFWAFPVNRGGADREAITTATALLEKAEVVGMFPEGTRKRDDAEASAAHGGVAFIASRADVPVVPTGIIGTGRAWPAGAKFPRLVPVTIRFGEPVYPTEFEGSRKEKVAAMTGEIMRRIDEQLAAGEAR